MTNRLYWPAWLRRILAEPPNEAFLREQPGQRLLDGYRRCTAVCREHFRQGADNLQLISA
ncbi:MAG: hypothetical protein HFF89_00535 [Oscillibacter sp.]|nr:hypothetical protein [Oscillibacter sp.]MCI8848448.1 hypothetical protein [Oscillibacter sp.]MCI9376320.1 hypothetical protein [Oscillibacter sp.]